MKTIDALEIVLSLARLYVESEHDNDEERETQREACDIVEDFVVNHAEHITDINIEGLF